MKLLRKLKGYVDQDLPPEASRWMHWVHHHAQLGWVALAWVGRSRLLTMSSALSFRTIFALVPILVLTLVMLRTVAYDDAQRALRGFLQEAGLERIELQRDIETADEDIEPADEDIDAPPASAPHVVTERRLINLADRLEFLVAEVAGKLTLGKVGPLGAVVLIWTALTLLITMETSLNRIFEARDSRPWASRILLYWAIITLTPVLLIAAEYVGIRLGHAAGRLGMLAWVVATLGWMTKVAGGTVAIAAVYKWMPFTRVSFTHAVRGAVVATLVWTAAKWGFAVYVTEVVGKGSVYGALGLLPIFLFWVNLSWTIFLMGAAYTHASAHLYGIRAAEQAARMTVRASSLLAAAVVVGRSFQQGRGPVTLEDLAQSLAMPEEFVGRLMDRLESGGVVAGIRTGNDPNPDAYTLTRPAELIGVSQVMEIAPGPEDARISPAAGELAQAIGGLQAQLAHRLGALTLAQACEKTQ